MEYLPLHVVPFPTYPCLQTQILLSKLSSMHVASEPHLPQAVASERTIK